MYNFHTLPCIARHHAGRRVKIEPIDSYYRTQTPRRATQSQLIGLDPCKDLFHGRLLGVDLVAIGDEHPGLEVRTDVVNLQFLGPRLELLDGDLDAWWVGTPLMAVQLDLFLDKLAEEEREEFLVVRRLVDVFSETLPSSQHPVDR